MQPKLEDGKVYVLGSVFMGVAGKEIRQYEKLRNLIDTFAKDFFTLRYSKDSDGDLFIPYGTDHEAVIKTVDVKIVSKIPKDAEKILDIGGSEGSRIVKIGSGLEKHVVDIAIPEKKESGVYFTQADISKGLPYNDRSFDCTTLSWTIAHVLDEDRRGLIKEVRRVLKPGGYLFIQDIKAKEIDGLKEDYEKRLKPLDYKLGDYFYAVFEAVTQKGIDKAKEESVAKEGKFLSFLDIPPKYLKNPKYRKELYKEGPKEPNPHFEQISLPMYGSCFTSERLEELYKGLFDLEDIHLIGYREEPGKVKPPTPEAEGCLLAVLKKK